MTTNAKRGTKTPRPFPPLKRGGYSARIRFADESRGERFFDSEWFVWTDDVRDEFLLRERQNYRGEIVRDDPAGRTIGTAIRPGDVVVVSVRRWTQTRVTDLPPVRIRIVDVVVDPETRYVRVRFSAPD